MAARSALTLRITYSDHPLGGWRHHDRQRKLDLRCRCTRPVGWRRPDRSLRSNADHWPGERYRLNHDVTLVQEIPMETLFPLLAALITLIALNRGDAVRTRRRPDDGAGSD